MLVSAPACAASQPAVPGGPALLLPRGCFLLIMQVFGAGGRQGEAQTTSPRESLATGVSTVGAKPVPFCPCALLGVPGTSRGVVVRGGRALHTPCSPRRPPQLGSNLLRFQYCARHPLGEYLNPWGMPGILKRIFNTFLPSKLSWLLTSAVKSSFSDVSRHLHAEGGLAEGLRLELVGDSWALVWQGAVLVGPGGWRRGDGGESVPALAGTQSCPGGWRSLLSQPPASGRTSGPHPQAGAGLPAGHEKRCRRSLPSLLAAPAGPAGGDLRPLTHLTQAVVLPQISLCLTWSAGNPNATSVTLRQARLHHRSLGPFLSWSIPLQTYPCSCMAHISCHAKKCHFGAQHTAV